MSASWRGTGAAWCLAATAALAAGPAAAVTAGQTDTFQDGTTDGWGTGSPSPNPPINVASGGPAGAADSYLRAYSSGVTGPGGRLVLFNTAQWAGDYVAAGITSLTMDVSNQGSTALELHLALSNPAFTSAAYTTVGVPLAVGSGWTRVSFPLRPADLSGAGGSVLGNVSELRLYSGGASAVVLAAQLGIDNITAVAAAVPEPATTALWLAGLAGCLALSRRRHARPACP